MCLMPSTSSVCRPVGRWFRTDHPGPHGPVCRGTSSSSLVHFQGVVQGSPGPGRNYGEKRCYDVGEIGEKRWWVIYGSLSTDLLHDD